MAGYLIDTNHLSSAIRPVSKVREQFYQAIRSGARLVTIVPVLYELETGLQNHAKEASLRRQLQGILKKVRLWPLGPEIAPLYGRTHNELIARGRILSQVDMMLIAMARYHQMTILTADQDFAAVPDVRSEDWSK